MNLSQEKSTLFDQKSAVQTSILKEKSLLFFFRLEVPMMSGVFEVPTGHSSDLECRVLEIPFTQKRMSMFVFLPDDPARGIYKLQDNATAKNVKSLLGTLKVGVNLRWLKSNLFLAFNQQIHFFVKI